jgi:hypothetical protein
VFGGSYFGSTPPGGVLTPPGGAQVAAPNPAISILGALDPTTARHVTPSNLPDLQVWLKSEGISEDLGADDPVPTWKDASGKHNDFITAGPASNEPVLSSVLDTSGGQHLAVSFQSSQQAALQGPDGAVGTVTSPGTNGDDFSVFTVIGFTGQPSDLVAGGIISVDAGDNFEGTTLHYDADVLDFRWGDFESRPEIPYAFNPPSDQLAFLLSAQYEGALASHEFHVYANGIAGSDTNTTGTRDSASGTQPLYLGWDAFTHEFADVLIAEVVWFSRSVTATERQQLERYFRAKYQFEAIAGDADGVTALPSPAVQSWTATVPTTAAPAIVTPSPATNSWAANTPTTVLGAITALPSAAVTTNTVPTVIVSMVLSVTTSAATNPWTAAAPSAVLGGVTGAAPPSIHTWLDPASVLLAGAVSVSTTPATAPWITPASTASLGGILGTPASATAVIIANTPIIALGSVVATPVAAVFTSVAASPVIILGLVTAVPQATSTTWVATTPSIALGSVTSTATPAINQWAVLTAVASGATIAPTASSAWAVPQAVASTGSTSSIAASAISSWIVNQVQVTAAITAVPLAATNGWSIPAGIILQSSTATVAVLQWAIPQHIVVLGGISGSPLASVEPWQALDATTALALTVVTSTSVATWQLPQAQVQNSVTGTPQSATTQWQALDPVVTTDLIVVPQPAVLVWQALSAETSVEGISEPNPAVVVWTVLAPSLAVLPLIGTPEPAIQPFVCLDPQVLIGPVITAALPIPTTWATATSTAYVGLYGFVHTRAAIEAKPTVRPTLASTPPTVRPTIEAGAQTSETLIAQVKTRKP